VPSVLGVMMEILLAIVAVVVLILAWGASQKT
jgi:hypothetical protein